ncbi:LacI family DNA-binding transcriptional regulator [Solitalea lacus]|uniref:LacI family DNA-binding transcriptional regulator n=1 Tax=Solitalea lacus TaxID=2911172 RepID=UPI001EDB5F7F|nr:LacI family DNA-binding transcriptional regulator [Solitalea lacus]UKJ06746.1 LacI family transcriptional regulator [Solitalea lacus]
MKEKEITIYDIAEKLGLSSATVSRALNGGKGNKKETIDLVMETASQMGYRLNTVASSLRKKETKTVGLIVPRINMFFHSMVISGVQDKAHEYGYNLLVSQSNEEINMEKELVNTMFLSRVDGLMLSTTMFTKDSSSLDSFIKKKIPLVFFDRVPQNYTGPVIEGDDYLGGFMATEHLIVNGCKRIAHFTGPTGVNIYKNRLAGYKDALIKHNLPVDDMIIFEHLLTKESSVEVCEKMFALQELPDALFASNDLSAIVAAQIAKDKGLVIPDDFAIVGYSNDPLTEIFTPSITSVDQAAYELGRLAFQTLHQQMNPVESLILPRKQVVGVNLIERESSKRQ